MKIVQIIISIILLSFKFAIAQQHFEGYIFAQGFGKNANESGIYNMDIELISNEDTLRTVTTFDGSFHFEGLKEKEVRLIGRKRHCITIDTIFKIYNNWQKDTFYCVHNRGKRESKLCYNRNTAVKDIQNLQMIILLPGGFVGTEIYNVDTIFENKYNIEYLSLGCTRFTCTNEAEYNAVIFKYLDERYGVKWRAEIRKETIGLVK